MIVASPSKTFSLPESNFSSFDLGRDSTANPCGPGNAMQTPSDRGVEEGRNTKTQEQSECTERGREGGWVVVGGRKETGGRKKQEAGRERI